MTAFRRFSILRPKSVEGPGTGIRAVTCPAKRGIMSVEIVEQKIPGSKSSRTEFVRLGIWHRD